MTSFQWLFEKFDLAAKLKALNATEIWLWGAPYFALGRTALEDPGDRIPYQTENPWFYRPLRHPGHRPDDLDHGLELRSGVRARCSKATATGSRACFR